MMRRMSETMKKSMTKNTMTTKNRISFVPNSENAENTTPITTNSTNSTISTENPSTTTPFRVLSENGRRNTNQHNQTLVFLDFDDTIYPSTYIQKNNNIDMELFKSYCHKSYQLLLSLIISYGGENIYIITNADGRWIIKCLEYLQRFPIRRNIANLIIEYKINIFSAKDQFASKYPNNCTKWKQAYFKPLIKKHYNQYIHINNQCMSTMHITRNNEGECAAENSTNIMSKCSTQKRQNNDKFVVVCIGDGSAEYMASHQAVKELNINRNNIILHRIKLLPKPSIPQLNEQFALIQLLSSVFSTELAVGMNINYKQEIQRHSSTVKPTNRGSSPLTKQAKSEKQKEGEKQCRVALNHKQKNSNYNQHEQTTKTKEIKQIKTVRAQISEISPMFRSI